MQNRVPGRQAIRRAFFRLQQAKGIPAFAKTAKSGAPAKSKTQLPSDLLEGNHSQVVIPKTRQRRVCHRLLGIEAWGTWH